MSQDLFTKNEIEINAAVSKVWDILVNPEKHNYICSDVKPFLLGKLEVRLLGK